MTDTYAIDQTNSSRPWITVVLAVSADGKITDRDRTPARFSSPADLAHLETHVAETDAVLFGANTLRAYGTCLSIRQPALLAQRNAAQKPRQPIQIVCSYSGQLDANLRFFRQSVPRWLLTTQTGAAAWQASGAFQRVLPWLTQPINWLSILQDLQRQGVQHLGVLGGGTLIGSLVSQDLVDELYLTICPLLLGGSGTPTPVDGEGLPIALAQRLQLLQVKQRGDEVFLQYRRCHLQRD